MTGKKVYVGMSGGVDSSLAAALLVEQGYDVIGVYMKNWTHDLPGVKCPWATDLADAKRVAVKLGIDFQVFDFESDYKQKVVDYMIEEYKRGHTPNPDIMCNQEVKFKLFIETALEDGADMIATGHYARIEREVLPISSSKQLRAGHAKGPDALSNSGSRGFDEEVGKTVGMLKTAVDQNKDQTYFLYRITGEALGKTLFPVGDFHKSEVRKMAEKRGLATADKKDSQGICFVGQVGIRDFLSQYVSQKPGDVIDKKTGQLLGRHDGAIFYTLGQRHGLDIGGGMPYYVVDKDMDRNIVFVSTDLNDESLWKKTVTLTNIHWINRVPVDGKYKIRIRHQAPLIEADIKLNKAEAIITLGDPQRAITPGQSIVIYDHDTCLGGGIVV